MNLLSLLRDRRFWPLFYTQFLGAFNDNFFKNALVILITYKAVKLWGLSAEQLVVLCGGIFIFPFFLFSATAGQIADKINKARLVVNVKILEIGIMLAAGYGFLTHHISFLLFALLLMGLHSTIFGPVKYSYLPQVLHQEAELVAANALFQMGTFLAILLGTIAGGLVIALDSHAELYTSVSALLIAILGWLFSTKVVPVEPLARDLAVQWNPITPTWKVIKDTRKNRTVFLSILGISWFWFFGASMLSLFPSYGKSVLQADEHVVTFFLALFSLGIGLGSMICKRLSGRKLELGLVPFGSLGLTVFSVDLFFATPSNLNPAPNMYFTFSEFLWNCGGWRIATDLFLMSCFGGLYIVPLMTMIQQRSDPAFVSRIIATNNILNALAMVLASVLLMILLGQQITIPTIFLIIGILNLVVAFYIYHLLPEFFLRFLAWILAHSLYRIEVYGEEKIPDEGGCILVCNHVTFIDWLIIAGACRRPPRFVMDHTYLKIPFAGFLFRDAKVIPIAQAKENAELMEAAFKKIQRELEAGALVCIFPEGRLTRDGKFSPFRRGIERTLATTPVPVVPMAMVGLWDSFFSYNREVKLLSFWKRRGKQVVIKIGDPIPAKLATAANLQAAVEQLYQSGEAKIRPE